MVVLLLPSGSFTRLIYAFYYKTALSYSPFIHNYEYDIYKSTPAYSVRLGIALREKQKRNFKLVRNPYRRSSELFRILNRTSPI